MFMAKAVFPILGRAARMISSPLCSPPVMVSKSLKWVMTPEANCSPCMRESIRSSDSLRIAETLWAWLELRSSWI